MTGPTGAETERITNSGIMGQFKASAQTTDPDIPQTQTFNFSNQKHHDDRLTVNNFTQKNIDVNGADIANYRNKTVKNDPTLMMDGIPRVNIDSVRQDGT